MRAALAALAALCLAVLAASGARASAVPHRRVPFDGAVQRRSDATPTQAPLWPTAFNATLAKINPRSSEIVWTKLYYDFSIPASRFDFYNGYVEQDDRASWALNCTIYFYHTTIWYVQPSMKRCLLRATDIPSIPPDFLRRMGAKFTGYMPFRAIPAQRWEFPDPANSTHTMVYFASDDAGGALPLRSPNQANDPGDTDFFDVMVGPQDPDVFTVPDYCETQRTTMGCPWF